MRRTKGLMSFLASHLTTASEEASKASSNPGSYPICGEVGGTCTDEAVQAEAENETRRSDEAQVVPVTINRDRSLVIDDTTVMPGESSTDDGRPCMYRRTEGCKVVRGLKGHSYA